MKISVNMPRLHALYCAQDGPASQLADRYTCGHLEAQFFDLSTCFGLGNVDEQVDGLTLGHCRVLMMS